MESKEALAALHALAQDTRLAAVRLLIQAGPNGMSAGEVAAQLGVQPSTLSTHLAILERAGLATSRRDARHIFYAAQYEGLRRLIGFLMEDCCQGRPEICGGLPPLAGCGPAACAPTATSKARSTRRRVPAGTASK